MHEYTLRDAVLLTLNKYLTLDLSLFPPLLILDLFGCFISKAKRRTTMEHIQK